MSELIPIITTTLGVEPEIAAKVIAGLEAKIYECVGGVIRRVDNKQVVTWLRTLSEGKPIDTSVLSKLGPLLQSNVATSVLSLSITAIGFGIVLRRLKSIDDRLAIISKERADTYRQLDLSTYANFQDALKLAHDAIGMYGDTNRRITTNELAIKSFRETQEYYLVRLDKELHAGSQAVSLVLSILFLAYASAARCYLELDQTETAWQHLQEGEAALSSRVKQYYDSIIGVNPAIFLHPALANTVSLERLTRLLRHYDAFLTESSAFESLRKEIWDTASRNPESWLRRLPASIWNHNVDGQEKKLLGHQPRSKAEMLKKVLPRLLRAFTQVELTQKSLSRIQGYGIEVKYLLDHNIEYSAWQQIELPATGPDDPVAILLPRDSELWEFSSDPMPH